MIDIPKYVTSKRSTYTRLPVVVRALIIAVAFLIGLIGLVLVFTPPPLFDVGVILLLLSLSVLSFQYSWAHSSLTYVTKRLASKSFRKKLFIAIAVIFLVFVGFVIYWLV